MKLFGYLLVACAGLGLFACSTEDDPTIENGDVANKSVSLKLNGIAGSLDTKAIEAGTMSAGEIVLKDLKIVFYDNSNPTGPRPIYRVEEFDGTSTDPTAAANWTALTGSTSGGYVFHDLDTKVNAVLVVGNYKNKGGTVTNEAALINWDNVASIKSSILLAKEENQSVADLEVVPTNSTKNYVTLWGEANLVPDATLPDTEHPTSTPANLSKWKASVNIAPLVSRFEIGNIRCTDLGTIYSSFDLKGLGLIDISLTNSITASSVPSVLPPRLVIGTNIIESGIPGLNQYIFGDPINEISWAYNAITPFVNISSSSTIYNPDGTKKFVYNFFPDPAGFPNIKLVLDNVMLKTGPESSFDYVVTAKFTSDPAHTIDVPSPTAGKIYTIDLAFKEENIGPWNPDDFKCVIVKVSVADWVIVPLYPVFR